MQVQKNRSEYLETLKESVLENVGHALHGPNYDLDDGAEINPGKNPTYAKFLQQLIVQGCVRLLERHVEIKCRKKDMAIVKSVLEGAKDDFNRFIKEKTGKDRHIELNVFKDKFLEKNESILGGVILYCRHNSIVYNNTIECRVELCFQDSKPDIKHMLFPNMSYEI